MSPFDDEGDEGMDFDDSAPHPDVMVAEALTRRVPVDGPVYAPEPVQLFRSTPPPLPLWEILVPTEKPAHMIRGKRRYFTVRYHRQWDEKVRAISGGLTIHSVAKGQWKSPSGELFKERMIPVRIACTRDQILEIGRMTKEYYGQEVVMITRISEEVIFI